MRYQGVARRYAKALFDLAVENNLLDQVAEELGMIRAAFNLEPGLREAVESRLVPRQEKKKILTGLAGREFSPPVTNFLLLVVDKGREKQIGAIVEEFGRLLDEARGMTDAEVLTAVELGDEEERLLAERLRSLTGREVRLRVQKDPSLIGGLVIKIGDKRIDGSVKRRLEELRKIMSGEQEEEGVGLT